MKRPAVFFDRDNTLIACDGYLGDPAKVDLIEGAADAIARVRALGFAAVVFSNQSGVARGMFTEEAVHAVNHRLDDLLHEEDPRAVIDRHDFCPFHPTAKVERYRVDSDLRKPRPGMIFQAALVLDLDLEHSWVVGDAPRDIAAGHAAGLRTVLLKIASLPPSPATNEGAGVDPDFVATSLQEAVDLIEDHMTSAAATDEEPPAPPRPAARWDEEDEDEEPIGSAVPHPRAAGHDAGTGGEGDSHDDDEPVETDRPGVAAEPAAAAADRRVVAELHGAEAPAVTEEAAAPGRAGSLETLGDRSEPLPVSGGNDEPTSPLTVGVAGDAEPNVGEDASELPAEPPTLTAVDDGPGETDAPPAESSVEVIESSAADGSVPAGDVAPAGDPTPHVPAVDSRVADAATVETADAATGETANVAEQEGDRPADHGSAPSEPPVAPTLASATSGPVEVDSVPAEADATGTSVTGPAVAEADIAEAGTGERGIAETAVAEEAAFANVPKSVGSTEADPAPLAASAAEADPAVLSTDASDPVPTSDTTMFVPTLAEPAAVPTFPPTEPNAIADASTATVPAEDASTADDAAVDASSTVDPPPESAAPPQPIPMTGAAADVRAVAADDGPVATAGNADPVAVDARDPADARPLSEAPTSPASPTAAPARTEDPVKFTPRPSSGKPDPSKPAKPASPAGDPAAAPTQGGFVVKPNQAPSRMTWGERMRVAKQPTPGGSAAAPATTTAGGQAPAAATRGPTTEPVEAEAVDAPAPVARFAERVAPVVEAVDDPPPRTDPEPEDDAVASTASFAATADVAAEAATDPVEPPEPTTALAVRRATAGGSVADADPIAVDAATAPDPAPAASRPPAGSASADDLSRVEDLLKQILVELRRREDQHSLDFSVSKLLAGITQVLALAAMFFAYLNKESAYSLVTTLVLALTLQTLTISLLIMGRQR
jgi:D-glycero-D-manno-heptose 1,7-bisphosphate phosphatase